MKTYNNYYHKNQAMLCFIVLCWNWCSNVISLTTYNLLYLCAGSCQFGEHQFGNIKLTKVKLTNWRTSNWRTLYWAMLIWQKSNCWPRQFGGRVKLTTDNLANVKLATIKFGNVKLVIKTIWQSQSNWRLLRQFGKCQNHKHQFANVKLVTSNLATKTIWWMSNWWMDTNMLWITQLTHKSICVQHKCKNLCFFLIKFNIDELSLLKTIEKHQKLGVFQKNNQSGFKNNNAWCLLVGLKYSWLKIFPLVPKRPTIGRICQVLP